MGYLTPGLPFEEVSGRCLLMRTEGGASSVKLSVWGLCLEFVGQGEGLLQERGVVKE